MKVLSHRIEGRGEPLVLLNGGLMTMASWDGIAQQLMESFTVIRCDFRGQLRSAGPPPPDLAGHAADLAALLDHLGIQRSHLVGTSFGGEVGLLFAATHPERTDSLLAATVTDLATAEFQGGATRMRQAFERVAEGEDPGRLWDEVIPTFYSPAWLHLHSTELALRRNQFAALPAEFFRGIAGLLSALDGLDLRPVLHRIACPTLLVVAGDDRTMPPERPAAMAAAIPGARLEIIEGAGHALVVERPETFSSICLAFVRGVVQARPGGRAVSPGNSLNP